MPKKKLEGREKISSSKNPRYSTPEDENQHLKNIIMRIFELGNIGWRIFQLEISEENILAGFS